MVDDKEEAALRDRIEEIILEFPGYGYRRVTHALHREGKQVNHKRVLRIMKEESILCRIKRSFMIKTTNSRHRFPVYPNLLAGLELTAPSPGMGFRFHVYTGKPVHLYTWHVSLMHFLAVVSAGTSQPT